MARQGNDKLMKIITNDGNERKREREREREREILKTSPCYFASWGQLYYNNRRGRERVRERERKRERLV